MIPAPAKPAMIRSRAMGPLTICMTCVATVSSGVPEVAANAVVAPDSTNGAVKVRTLLVLIV
jgi:hypothetical protein